MSASISAAMDVTVSDEESLIGFLAECRSGI